MGRLCLTEQIMACLHACTKCSGKSLQCNYKENVTLRADERLQFILKGPGRVTNLQAPALLWQLQIHLYCKWVQSREKGHVKVSWDISGLQVYSRGTSDKGLLRNCSSQQWVGALQVNEEKNWKEIKAIQRNGSSGDLRLIWCTENSPWMGPTPW